jgi:alkylation response protein AidB-like acyl-CoA dehydrogenase
MNFAYTEEQEMLRKTARNFLETYCPKTLVREMEKDEKDFPVEIWHEMANLGWQGLIFPQEYGGAGGNFLDLIVLLEEMGRACLTEPFFSSIVLGGLVILEVGSTEQKMKLLPKIARGDLILTLALTEPSASYDSASITVKASPHNSFYIINGTKLFVPNVQIADYLVCVTKTGSTPRGGITLFLIDAKSPGISYTLLKTTDGSKQYELTFNSVEVSPENMLSELDHGWQTVQKVLAKAAVAKCAEMLGGLQKVLEMSIQYAKDRVQFSRPIGANQAIQFHCADIAITVDASRFLTYQAAWRISKELPCIKEVAMAKAWVSEAYPRVCYLGQLVHGGIGFCLEHDLSFYISRAKAAEVTFGDTSLHHEVIAQELGL